MQFLKTLFWVALAIILVLFATENWHSVTMRLWGGLEADVKLPVLIFASFLLGFLPMLVIHRARLWGLRRRPTCRRPKTVSPPTPRPGRQPELSVRSLGSVWTKASP
jgi:lipopolysaccharide assembly protein A